MWNSHRDQKQKLSGFVALSILIHFGAVVGFIYYKINSPSALPETPMSIGASAIEVVQSPFGKPDVGSPVAEPEINEIPEAELKAAELELNKAKLELKKSTPVKAAPIKETPVKKTTKGDIAVPTKNLPTQLPVKKEVAPKKQAKKSPKNTAKKLQKTSNKIPTVLPGRKTVAKSNDSNVPVPEKTVVVAPQIKSALDDQASKQNPVEKPLNLKDISAIESAQAIGGFDELPIPEDETTAMDPEMAALERDLNQTLDDDEASTESIESDFSEDDAVAAMMGETPEDEPDQSPFQDEEEISPPLQGNSSGAPGSIDGLRDADSLRQFPGNRPPAYPQRDRLQRKEGVVTLVAYVTNSGQPTRLKVAQSSGTNRMNANALRAFSKYRFYKGQKGYVRQTYVFRLSGNTGFVPAKLGRR